MRVMIHACPQRMWYVEEHLVPSLAAQGIQGEDLLIWNDTEGHGNQLSWFESCRFLAAVPGGTWHLQDDVLISSDFRQRCEASDEGIVAGFGCESFGPNIRMTGIRPAVWLFHSFQCLRLPNRLAGEHAKWYFEDARHRRELREWVLSGKKDDSFFHLWLEEEHPAMEVLNACPCLVEHVDWLIGGSVLNPARGRPSRAYAWEEEDRVRELAAALGRGKILP